MRSFIVFLSVIVAFTVFEKPAEAGLFRGGLMRRLFFGGPIRRRMFGRPMMRRPFCGNCVPRRSFNPGRCGNGIHRGGCGGNFRNFQNRNFRDLRGVPNFPDFERNFRDTGNPFLRRDQFEAPFDPGFGLTNAPAAPGFTNSPVSRVERVLEDSIREKFAKALKPDSTEDLLGSSWKGKCENDQKVKRNIVFNFPEATNFTQKKSSVLLKVSETESYEIKLSADQSELLVKISKTDEEEYCALQSN
jgi:hypothetical protein